ncbi:MAG: quinol:cytochrome C oxidoreductase [Cyclobacteriaceae bacterium]|nr:quinol:cytochrome C oxidoreductase [Cyclobacteriaceae bacterium]
MNKEVFIFTPGAKKNIAILAITGLVLVILGIILMMLGGGHAETAGAAHEISGHDFHWSQRLYTDLWINNIYFIGLGLIGIFFFAVQYAAQAGWSAPLLRIPLAFGYWLPYAFVVLVIVFILANFTGHWHLFHWLDQSLYAETLSDGSANPHYDPIIAGKRPFLNLGFYTIRTIIFFVVWIGFFIVMKKEHYAEDVDGKISHWKRLITMSAIFIIFFALSSAVASWDWVMSIDTHWYSTIFGWYIFASWFVSGLAAITLMVTFLRENGYLPMINENHLHDLGKYVFAFSIFWTYIWFSQFMLIYYANIPEESVYFVERLSSDIYAPVFYLNFMINFFFPFLVLMTRDAKRHGVFLKIVCIVVLFGHWLDFYLMVTPGALQENGGFGFLEIGTIMIYLAAFLFIILNGLSKSALVPKNHPMMQESLYHHI